nr:GerAB/ArcD/ProY family transporter [Bacillus tianshenii]
MFAMLLFLLGSSVIFGLNLSAEKAAWVVSLVAGSIGLLLFWMNAYIWRNNDYGNLSSILRKNFGKFLGIAASLAYVLYFAYLASRVLTDFTMFINSQLLYSMKPFLIKFSIFLVIAYTYLKGLEAFIRSAVIIGGITVPFLLLLPFWVLVSGTFNWEYIEPILDMDFKKIASTLPTMITFPFGELIAFLMIFPYLKREHRSSLSKKGSYIMIFFTLLLSLFSFLSLGVLHPNMAKNYTFPMISAIEKVILFDFVKRLDIFAVIIIIFGGYFKISIFTFASVNLAKYTMTKVKPQVLTISILVIILLLSYTYAENISQHLEVGLKYVPLFIHLPLAILVPILLLFITFIRKKRVMG